MWNCAKLYVYRICGRRMNGPVVHHTLESPFLFDSIQYKNNDIHSTSCSRQRAWHSSTTWIVATQSDRSLKKWSPLEWTVGVSTRNKILHFHWLFWVTNWFSRQNCQSFRCHFQITNFLNYFNRSYSARSAAMYIISESPSCSEKINWYGCLLWIVWS